MTIILIIATFIGGVITGKWVIPFFTKAETTVKTDISKVDTDINTAKTDVNDLKKKI